MGWKQGNPCEPCCCFTHLKFQAIGCDGYNGGSGGRGPVVGAPYTITNGQGVVVATGTTDAFGLIYYTATRADTYTATVNPAPRYQPASGSLTVTAPCPANLPTTGGSPIYLSPDNVNYACWYDCTAPIKTTLHLTDSLYGTFTMVYHPATGDWITETKFVNVAALVSCNGCPSSASNVSLYFRIGGVAGGTLQAIYSSVDPCFGNFCVPHCPLDHTTTSFTSTGTYFSLDLISCAPLTAIFHPTTCIQSTIYNNMLYPDDSPYTVTITE